MQQPTPKRDYLFNIWYFVVVIAYIVIGAFPDVRKYFIWLKPLPVLLLILQIHKVRQTHRSVLFIQLALLFGMIGDIFLQISGSKYYFNIGVASFFIGHVLYINAFLGSVKLLQIQTSTRSSLFFAIIYATLVAGAMMTNMHYIWKNVQSIKKIGFSFYSTALSCMSISAFYFALKSRFDSNLKFASVSIFLGSLIFMISDATLSEKQKNDSIDSNTKQIMSYIVGVTYWTAQFLITQGGLKISTIQLADKIEKQVVEDEIKDTIVTSETIAQPLL